MILIVIMITKMFQKIEGYGWGMKKGKKIFKKPRHEVTLVAQWRQMPHIKNDDQFSQRSFLFFKSELEDLAPDNKTSDLSLIFFILDTYLK